MATTSQNEDRARVKLATRCMEPSWTFRSSRSTRRVSVRCRCTGCSNAIASCVAITRCGRTRRSRRSAVARSRSRTSTSRSKRRAKAARASTRTSICSSSRDLTRTTGFASKSASARMHRTSKVHRSRGSIRRRCRPTSQAARRCEEDAARRVLQGAQGRQGRPEADAARHRARQLHGLDDRRQDVRLVGDRNEPAEFSLQGGHARLDRGHHADVGRRQVPVLDPRGARVQGRAAAGRRACSCSTSSCSGSISDVRSAARAASGSCGARRRATSPRAARAAPRRAPGLPSRRACRSPTTSTRSRVARRASTRACIVDRRRVDRRPRQRRSR